MRFKPIETLPGACPLFVDSAYEHLVNCLMVYAWHWYTPTTASELERFLIYGQSQSRRSDFHELRWFHDDYSFGSVFDHSICFKSKYALNFVLTMPYGNSASFYKAFDGFKKDYYEDKARIAHTRDHLGSNTYSKRNWTEQLNAMPRFDATIVPNWFKIRKNGDFAAIVAMDNQLRLLSEHGGFPLVMADGSER